MTVVNSRARIYVAGHRGMVGSAIVRALEARGFPNILKPDRNELDLTDQKAVSDFFASAKPEYVYLVAAKVGGIMANASYPADFLGINLKIQSNVIDSAHKSGTSKLLFLGSSCIYPRLAEQPIKEGSLLTGPLEPTNEWYAVAKIAGIKLCQAYNKQYGTDFISGMPTNLYGYNDNFDLETSHVLPALIARFHAAKIQEAKSVQLWGTGAPLREFLFVDDLAEACLFLMDTYTGNDHVNIGSGREVSIKGLAQIVSGIIGYEGKLEFDTSKPEGTPRKLLDVSRMADMGWKATTSLEQGIRMTYDWYVKHLAEASD